MSDENAKTKTEHFGFLQVPNYSMIAFSSALEPLRMANRNANREIYRWSIYTIDGLPEKASNGLEITPDESIDKSDDIDTLFLSRRNVAQVAGQTFVGEGCNNADIARFQEANDFGNITGHRLGEPADRLRNSIGTTVNADILHLRDVIETCATKGHQDFKVVKAANR